MEGLGISECDMSKERDFFDALHDLRRNYPTNKGTTWSECSTDGCTNSARGGGFCACCCETKIALITGDAGLANDLHNDISNTHEKICIALDTIG